MEKEDSANSGQQLVNQFGNVLELIKNAQLNDWKKHIGKPNREFLCAHYALKFKTDIDTCFRNLQEYLNKICSAQLSNDWTFNLIFKYKWKEKEDNNRSRATVYAAKITLDRILSDKKLDDPIIIGFLEDLVCDIKPFILQIDESQDFSWLLLNTNNSISRFYHDEVCYLLYGNSNKQINFDARFALATLVIRHSIEHRIKRLIGIDMIHAGNRSISFSKILDAIAELSTLRAHSDINFSRIKKINDWANHYLHRGMRPFPWQLEWAEKEIGGLFLSGQTSDPKKWSLFASFEVDDLKEFRKEFIERLKCNFPNDEIEVHWAQNPEVVINNRNDIR